MALRVARAKKAHNIAEKLVLPCAIDMCEEVWDEKCAAKLKAVPLSDNTIVRRIEDMSEDIKSQLTDRVKTGFFFLHYNLMKAHILPMDLNLWCMYDIAGKVKCLKIFYFAILGLLEQLGRKFLKYWTLFLNQACYGASILAYVQMGRRQ